MGILFVFVKIRDFDLIAGRGRKRLDRGGFSH